MVLNFGIEDFPYKDYIKSPDELGMSSRGDIGTLTNDIGGLFNYIQVLTEGRGRAIRGDKPLGNRYFFKTGAKCKDIKTDEEKDRYLYIDNVPAGSLKGLLPGLVQNITKIKPEKLFDVFSKNPNNSCAAVTLDTINKDLRPSRSTRHLNIADIKSINNCLWTNKTNPITGTSGGDCSGEPQNGVCDGCVRETYANIYDDNYARYDNYAKYGSYAKYSNYANDKYIITILLATFFLLICLKLKKNK